MGFTFRHNMFSFGNTTQDIVKTYWAHLYLTLKLSEIIDGLEIIWSEPAIYYFKNHFNQKFKFMSGENIVLYFFVQVAIDFPTSALTFWELKSSTY